MGSAVYFTVVQDVAAQKRGVVKNDIIIQLLRKITADPEGHFDIAAEPTGRPIVRHRPDIFISVSHSGPTLACAATQLGPLGIDIEVARADRDFGGIAAFAFGPGEQARVAQEGISGFYRTWALREAIAKAHGAGLVEVADRQDRAADGPDRGTWRWQDWHLTHEIRGDGVHLALAVQTDQVAPIDWIELSRLGT